MHVAGIEANTRAKHASRGGLPRRYFSDNRDSMVDGILPVVELDGGQAVEE